MKKLVIVTLVLTTILIIVIAQRQQLAEYFSGQGIFSIEEGAGRELLSSHLDSSINGLNGFYRTKRCGKGGKKRGKKKWKG